MQPANIESGTSPIAGGRNDPDTVRALQRDLRALGYLRHGIDGCFGDATTKAIRALQFDLLHNNGHSTQGDGTASSAIAAYNTDDQGNQRVTSITGQLDPKTAACLADLMADPKITKLPASDDPRSDNAKALEAIATIVSGTAPTPFVAAMVLQESAGCHYSVPRADDADSFVTIGLDRNDRANSDRITSRGYGIGQYTFFHHPLAQGEIDDFVVDPVRNVQNAFGELRRKLDRFVLGPDSRADDRLAEHPHLPLRLCKYQASDARYMRDCKACAAAAGKIDIQRGRAVYAGATTGYQPTQYYPSADFQCDWPYAARRYNGSGLNSFHYQTKILLNLLK